MADVLGKRHQTVLEPFHEQHQPQHDHADADRDAGGAGDMRLQSQALEQGEKQRYRNHCAELFDDANTEVGCHQPVEIPRPQPRTPPMLGVISRDLVVTEGDLADSNLSEIVAVADFFRHIPSVEAFFRAAKHTSIGGRKSGQIRPIRRRIHPYVSPRKSPAVGDLPNYARCTVCVAFAHPAHPGPGSVQVRHGRPQHFSQSRRHHPFT